MDAAAKMHLYLGVFVTAVLLTFDPASTTVEHTSEMDTLADLLGIPVGEDVGPRREVPEYLQSVYQCWNSESDACMPEGMSDVNVVRSFMGTETMSPPKAFQSYNHQTELTNSLTIQFNVTYKMRHPESETINYALLRVFRKALSASQISDLREKCDFSTLNLRIYSTLSTTDKGDQIVILKKVEQLNFTAESLRMEKWYSFSNFTDVYKDDVMINTNIKGQLVTLRLSISDSSVCSGISPSLLGFGASGEHEAELIGFSTNSIQEDAFTSHAITALSSVVARKRRQADIAASTEAKKAASTEAAKMVTTTEAPEGSAVGVDYGNVTTSRPEDKATLEERRKSKCQLYSHVISFVDLDWHNYVLEPRTYNANYCIGHCLWPLEGRDNTTKHSYIQGVANNNDPDLVPPPCCVPKDLVYLAVTLQQANGVVETKRWKNMRARSCACR